ncbi:unnamed protein product [Prunus armeniaca]
MVLSKEDGGLGVANLSERNKALLAKWLWRYPRETSLFWHKMIRSKYGEATNGWDANLLVRGSSCSPWKDISFSWNFGLRRNLNEAEIAEMVGLLDKLEGARLFHSRTVHVQSSSLQIV